MKKLLFLIFSFAVTGMFLGCEDEPAPPGCEEITRSLSMQEIQVIGSHNSYHKKTTEEIMDFLQASGDILPEDFDPGYWEYGHADLQSQLNDYGIRSLELDVYRDPEGGLFYNRKGNALVGMDVASHEPELMEPGLKVLHFPDFDYNTYFLTFKDALHAIRSWSNDHPGHFPMTVLVEAKEDAPMLMLPDYNLTATMPFFGNSVEEIESEILDVFGSDLNHLIIPDDVRGMYATLRRAVEAKNWPTLEESRGKLIFVLMSAERVRNHYLEGHPNLENRMMFVFTEDNNCDHSAFIKLDDPRIHQHRIREYVRQGYMVRTQADANTIEARTNNAYRWKRALSSGAQIISTDYYRSDPHLSDYYVAFPDHAIAVTSIPAMDDIEKSCPVDEDTDTPVK